MRFNCIVADPPWTFSDKLNAMKRQTKRSAQSQYNVMTLKEIAELDIKSITDHEWCILALWVPSILLPYGLHVMNEWGFNYKQTFIWVKTKKNANKENDLNVMTAFGMGRIFRQTHELCLIGTTGNVYKHLTNKSQRSVCLDINKGHSIKPELLQDRLDLMFPTAQKIELFARRHRKVWTTIGNGVTDKDIKESIRELASS